MTVSVQSVIDRVQTTLQDVTGVRWPVQQDIIYWINDAQREVALMKPDASAQNVTVTLVAGTKQDIPDNGSRLLRVVRNMNGATGGRAIRLVNREVLDAQHPDWHSPTVGGDAAFGTEVKHYVYDESDPRHFYVYPGITTTADVELIYSANPSQVAEGDDLSIADIYANAVYNYVMYSCYMKDAEYAGNAQRASNHYQLFQASVMGKTDIDLRTTPNLESRANPNLTAMINQ